MTVPPLVEAVVSSSGQPLDGATRAFMESRFGHDFSHVRVHTDRSAAESSQAMGARAYTVGRDLVFGSGEYGPGTAPGRQLLAHELSHTIQQGASPPRAARRGDSAVGGFDAPTIAPSVQRAMKFEFQTRNVVRRVRGTTEQELPRKFGPPRRPKHSFFLHKGQKGKPATATEEGSAIELQSEEGGFLEFETPKWFRNWCELKERVQEAVDITAAIDRGTLVRTSDAGKPVRSWPFNTEHLKKTKNFPRGLRSGESLQVEIFEPDWKARIQASEAIDIQQYESLMTEHELPHRATASVARADKILNDANTEGTPASEIANLRSFLQVVVNYVIRGQASDVGGEPAKAAFRLMARTNFASMYRSLLTEREQALFRRIVHTDAILNELGLTRESKFFKHGHGSVPASEGFSVHAWLRSIHRQGEKRSGRDLASPPAKGSQAMGRFNVETRPGKKDTGLVKFEVRGSVTHGGRRPASEWVKFAEDVFKSAATNRPRTGPTALEFNPADCP
jgi:hypothetical protein